MKTIDIFRAGINTILASIKSTQRDIAIKFNSTYEPNNAASDFNNFLHDRRNYSLKRQTKLAKLLSYTYKEVIEIGENIMKGKESEPQFTFENGTIYSVTILSKMTREILSSNIKELEFARMHLVKNIVQYWQFFKNKQK